MQPSPVRQRVYAQPPSLCALNLCRLDKIYFCNYKAAGASMQASPVRQRACAQTTKALSNLV